MPPAPELRDASFLVFLGGCPCSLSKMDGLWWKILLKFYWNEWFGDTPMSGNLLKMIFWGDPIVLYMHNDIASHFWRYLRFNWKWTTLIILW
jgi:hypothetical protein